MGFHLFVFFVRKNDIIKGLYIIEYFMLKIRSVQRSELIEVYNDLGREKI